MDGTDGLESGIGDNRSGTLAVVLTIVGVILLLIVGVIIFQQITNGVIRPTSAIQVLAMPILYSNDPKTIEKMRKQQMSLGQNIYKIMLIIGAIIFIFATIGINF